MRNYGLILIVIIAFSLAGCTPLEKISRHDFDSGYYIQKSSGNKPENIYLNLKDDTITIYDVRGKGRKKEPDLASARFIGISEIGSGTLLYKNTFIRKSVDFDLSTVALKYRPETATVPNQLSYNVNALIYTGLRRDFFVVRTHTSPIKKHSTSIRQVGIDAGFLAGIGITPVNPTVTGNIISQEYDGFFFQKGIGVFFTLERLSLGLSAGFDNLIDKNSKIWIYDQRPWFGVVLGLANF